MFFLTILHSVLDACNKETKLARYMKAPMIQFRLQYHKIAGLRPDSTRLHIRLNARLVRKAFVLMYSCEGDIIYAMEKSTMKRKISVCARNTRQMNLTLNKNTM
ncbi:hypothetical protein AVEN_110668-1 [Araneus ventricosus]|uniref:Uncharacterized protein n=1 Tax=Araneus ventricosus TaxID=182803 RepID=A0A4Y2AW92_ARAVE|nr:hypothetical protein AVEN_110668-1 [Araneus ventricosus]